jgi:hypothetical protein
MDGRHTFNLHHWLSRLGVKGSEMPPVVPVVQPVQLVGDASLLVPPLLPACAAFGRVVGAVAAEYSSCEIQSRSPGGTWIQLFEATCGTASSHGWRVQAAPLTFSASNTLTAHQFGNGSTLSQVRAGTCAAGQQVTTGDNPGLFTGSYDACRVNGLVYLPFGSYFVHSLQTADRPVSFSVVLQDLPVSSGPE